MNYTAHETVEIEQSAIGDRCTFAKFVNVYNSVIGDDVGVASFVEIGGSVIGNRCRLQAFAFLCPGVWLEDEVFVGPHVCFTNDKIPRVGDACDRQLTVVRRGASIGAGSVICPGVVIGENAIIGAGSVVSENVPAAVVVRGDAAKVARHLPSF